MENIEYDYLIQDSQIDREQLDEIVDLMLETVCTSHKTIRVAGDDYPAELVKSKYMKLNGEHIRFVLDGLRENTTRVRNIKQYLRAMLFNAPSTISNYYTALVAHDMAQPNWGKSKSGLPDGSCGGDESLYRGRRKFDLYVPQRRPTQDDRQDHRSHAGYGRG